MDLELRRWQIEALARWRPRRGGVASVVTGAGKSVLGLACFKDELQRHPDTRVLIIVPTLALLDQWASVLSLVGNFPTSAIALHSGRHHETRGAKVNVTTVNTARLLTKALTGDGSRWMLIADECHRYASPANRTALEAEWTATLGLSATPSREYDTWFEEYVEPTLGKVIYEYDYRQAVKDGVLVPFAIKNYRVPLTPSEQERVDRYSRVIARLASRRDPGDQEALKRASISRARTIQGASARLRAAREIMAQHKGERAIVFHEQVERAGQLAEQLHEDGHRVALYHSAMAQPDRLRSLLLFKTGQVDVLVSCRALDEGLDVPEATFGLICSSSASTRQRIQRMGRLLRTGPLKGSAEVATIYASSGERARLASEERTLEGVASVSWYEVVFG